MTHPLAGQPAPADVLTDIPALLAAYFEEVAEWALAKTGVVVRSTEGKELDGGAVIDMMITRRVMGAG